jgi:hypothetical protein
MQSDESRRFEDPPIDKGSRPEYGCTLSCGSGGCEKLYFFEEAYCLCGIGSFDSSIKGVSGYQQTGETRPSAFKKSDLSDDDLCGVSKCFLQSLFPEEKKGRTPSSKSLICCSS